MSAEPAQSRTHDRRDVGDANMDPGFLYPETSDGPCPISTTSRKLSKEDATKYIQWIQQRVPDIKRRDQRVYCAYCDMKNHARLSRNHLHKTPEFAGKALMHTTGNPPLLCSRAQINNGIASGVKQRLHLIRSKRQTFDGVLMATFHHYQHPAEQPPTEILEQSALQEPAPEETAPLCAAGGKSTRPTTTTTSAAYRPTSSACQSSSSGSSCKTSLSIVLYVWCTC